MKREQSLQGQQQAGPPSRLLEAALSSGQGTLGRSELEREVEWGPQDEGSWELAADPGNRDLLSVIDLGEEAQLTWCPSPSHLGTHSMPG